MAKKPQKKRQATGKERGGKTPKVPREGKTPKVPKKPSKNIPTIQEENWRGGKRLVCRIAGKFCTIPEAMKKWKEMSKERPRRVKVKSKQSKQLPSKRKEIVEKFLKRKGNSLPKDGQQTPIPKDGQQTPIPKDGQKTPMPKDGQKTPMPKDGQKTPMPKDGKQLSPTSIPKDGQQTPIPKDGKQLSPTSMPGGGKQLSPTSIPGGGKQVGSNAPTNRDPNAIRAWEQVAELREQYGYPVSETDKRNKARGEAQKLRDKFNKAKEQSEKLSKAKGEAQQSISKFSESKGGTRPTQPPKTQSLRPPGTQGNSSDFIEKVGEMINQRVPQGVPEKQQAKSVTNLGKKLQQNIQAASRKAQQAVASAGEAATNIAKKTAKALSKTAKAIQNKTGKAVQNADRPKAPLPSPIATDWRTNPLTSRGMQQPETVGKKIRKKAGKAVEKAVDIIANPYVQVGLEVYSAPKNIERLKQKGAGPFETYMHIGGRMAGAIAGEAILPKPLRLLPIEEEVGGAIAGTAGRIIDKTGAGKVIIDTTVRTAKELDKLFPGQQIDINKKRTRPTFKERIGEM